MEKSGYPRNYATALVACASILGQLIPPSIAGIMYAMLTYQSIPGCWLATVGPGILTVIIFCTLWLTDQPPAMSSRQGHNQNCRPSGNCLPNLQMW
jgi:TRAP-type C4-dicarboxylate transport system permease large subunit